MVSSDGSLMGVVKILAKVRRMEERAAGIGGNEEKKRQERASLPDACRHEPPPPSMMRASKGASLGSDETPTSTGEEEDVVNATQGERRGAAGVVHPTICVTLQSSLGESLELSSSWFFDVLPPPFDE